MSSWLFQVEEDDGETYEYVPPPVKPASVDITLENIIQTEAANSPVSSCASSKSIRLIPLTASNLKLLNNEVIEEIKPRVHKYQQQIPKTVIFPPKVIAKPVVKRKTDAEIAAMLKFADAKRKVDKRWNSAPTKIHNPKKYYEPKLDSKKKVRWTVEGCSFVLARKASLLFIWRRLLFCCCSTGRLFFLRLLKFSLFPAQVKVAVSESDPEEREESDCESESEMKPVKVVSDGWIVFRLQQ